MATDMQDTTMRFATWNVGHQTRRKALPERIGAALSQLGSDVVVLTEYVYDDAHSRFLAVLKGQGLVCWLVSDYVAHQNQVLIASRFPLERGGIQCTARLSAATG